MSESQSMCYPPAHLLNQTGPAGSSSGQPVWGTEQTEEATEDFTMVDVGQTDPATSYPYQAYGHSHQENSLPTMTMPPQGDLTETSSWNRPYGQHQFRSMFAAYQANWEQGQTRTKTLDCLRSMCETAVQEDIMLMFQMHAMYFFEENFLPTKPHEDEFNDVQHAIISGELVPTNV